MELLKLENFKSTDREINRRLEERRREEKRSYLDEALLLNDGTSADQIKRHILTDSGNSLLIAKRCELYRISFWKPEDIATGRVFEIIEKELAAREWTWKILAFKMWKKASICEFPQFLNRVYKLKDDKSTNGFMLALIREVFGMGTPNPLHFLNDFDRKELEKKAQLEMKLIRSV